MIRPGMFLKHKQFKDVCLRITKIYNYGHGLSIKADWWNMGYENSFPIGHLHKIRLNFSKHKDYKGATKKHTFNDWFILRSPKSACVRYDNWESL